MTVKIGLISDVHATVAPLQEALDIFDREGVETVICAGDIAGYGRELEKTVTLLKDCHCRAVMGNHDLWCLERSGESLDGETAEFLRQLPIVMELDVAEERIYVVHASPPDSIMEGIKLLDEDAVLLQYQMNVWSDYLKGFPCNVLVIGHTHQVFAERLGDTLVINPGSTRFNHTCAILSLPEMTVEVFPLQGKVPVLSWNWGMQVFDH